MNAEQAQQYVQTKFDNTGDYNTASLEGDSQTAMDYALSFIGERVGQWYEAENEVKYFVSECGNFCLSLWQNFPRAFVCRYTA